jgi:hypothetical protein
MKRLRVDHLGKDLLTGRLIRIGGLAAVIAGTLRFITSLLPATTPFIVLFYFLVDVFLLLGTIGLYGFQGKEIGVMGTFGFLLQMIGILLLIGRDVAIFGASLYPVGALTFALGLDLFAISSWRIRRFAPWILLLWILSTIVGPVGYFAPGLRPLFALSGILFGIAFAAAGFTVLSEWARKNH